VNDQPTDQPINILMVDDSGMKSKKDFGYWIDICLSFNKKAKSSKKRK